MFRRPVKFRYGSDIRKLPIAAPLRSIAELQNVAHLLYQPKLSNSDDLKFMYIDADGDLINLRSDEDVRLAFENTAELLIYVLPGFCADDEEPCTEFRSSHIGPQNETAGFAQHLAVLHSLVLSIISKATNFGENGPGKQALQYKLEGGKIFSNQAEAADGADVPWLSGPNHMTGCANDAVTDIVSASNTGTTESTGTEMFYSCRSQLGLSSSLKKNQKARKLQTALPSSRDCVTSAVEEWHAATCALTRPYFDKAKSTLSAVQFQMTDVSESPLHARNMNHTTPILICSYGDTYNSMKTVPIWTNTWWTSSPVAVTTQGPQILSEVEIQMIRLMKLKRMFQRLLFQGGRIRMSRRPPERHMLNKLEEKGIQTPSAFGTSSKRSTSAPPNPYLLLLRSKTYKKPLGSQMKKTKSPIGNLVNTKKDDSATKSNRIPKYKQRTTRTVSAKNHNRTVYRITGEKVCPGSRTLNASTQSLDIKYCLGLVKENKLMFLLLTTERPKAAHLIKLKFMTRRQMCLTNTSDDQPRKQTARLEGVRNDGFTKSQLELDDFRANSHQNNDGEDDEFEGTIDLLPPLSVLMLAVESVPSVSEFSVCPMDSKFSQLWGRCQGNLQYIKSQRQNNHSINEDLQKHEAERQKMYTSRPSSTISTGTVPVDQISGYPKLLEERRTNSSFDALQICHVYYDQALLALNHPLENKSDKEPWDSINCYSKNNNCKITPANAVNLFS
ncbi:unnamed protein product [Calicophoron daubneyi]|uniref:PB1 domain-containing protein n=1 Tax=Calicophoron daubneyi TaxID=300641 RepID=A0AAV2T065_CALDB